MESLDYSSAVLLGAVQALTEFLPVSSSGHLGLTQTWLGLQADSPEMLMFDVCSHVGTLFAILFIFRQTGLQFVRRLKRELGPGHTARPFALRLTVLAILATSVTACIGLLFKDRFESVFAHPKWIGAGLIVTAVLLVTTTFVSKGKRGLRKFPVSIALAVGIAQGIAVYPGISRSGSTISVAQALGLRRLWAAQFSFLIAIPAILGASLLKAKDVLELESEVAWGPIAAGTAVSMIVGCVALSLLLGVIRQSKLHYFAVYCALLGLIVMVFG